MTIYYPEEAKSCTLEIILFKNAQSKIEKPRNAAFLLAVYAKYDDNMSYL